MRIVVVHSDHEKCGVGQYGHQLDRSLVKVPGVEGIVVCNYSTLHAVDVRADDRVLCHFEPGLVGDAVAFHGQLRAMRQKRAKIVLCCHLFEPWIGAHYASMVDLFVLHRTYYDAPAKSVQIPLGAPVYEPSGSREALREKFNLPSGKMILTTVGFLTAWKRTPEVVGAVLAVAPPDVCFVRVQTPWPFDAVGASAQREEDALRSVIAPFGGLVQLSTEFMPEGDLLDLVHASDLGFVFHGIDTGSVSAATKQFVSARTPLVVTGSSHSSDIIQGVRRVSGFDPGGFAREVVRVAGDAPMMEKLRKGIVAEYARINMDVVAKRYVEELGRLV